MRIQAFLALSCERSDRDFWLISGRAYTSIALGDSLWTSRDDGVAVRVEDIVSYGRKTDLLSPMMTGTLVVVGDLHASLRTLFAELSRWRDGCS